MRCVPLPVRRSVTLMVVWLSWWRNPLLFVISVLNNAHQAGKAGRLENEEESGCIMLVEINCSHRSGAACLLFPVI